MSNWQRTTRLVIAAAAVAFAIVVALAFQRRADIPDATPIASTDPRAVLESAGGRTFRLNRDKEDVRIEYDRLLSYADGSSKLLGVKVITERAGGRIFTVTAGQALVADAESNLELVGDVRLTVSDGMDVRTERATYLERDGVVRAPGPVEFSRARLTGSGVGLTYDKNRDVLTILEQAVVHVASGKGGNGLDVSSGLAELNRRDQLVRFERAMKASRGGQTIEADAGVAHLGAEDERLERVELRGHSRITGGAGRADGLESMTGRDMDLTYGADGETLQHATVTGDAAVRLAGEGGGRRIRAATVEVALAPDGATPTALSGRDDVALFMPGAGGVAREIRAETLAAAGEAGRGLTTARFTGAVRFTERGEGLNRTATSERLDVALTPGSSGIDEATFDRDVRFEDGRVVATAPRAHYAIDQGIVELSGAGPGLVRPNVKDGAISIDGNLIILSLDGPRIDAAGAVTSVLRPGGGGDGRTQVDAPAETKLPSMLKQDQPVTVTADALSYDSASSRATYTGRAQLWQAETTIKGTTIVVDDETGDLSASGEPVVTTAVLLQEGKDGTKVRSVASAKAKAFTYEEAQRRASYLGEAYVNGPQGDLRADKIELYLKASGDELERAEAYDSVTLAEQRRKTTGARMTYFSADQRYVVTGAPVTIVDECGRDTIGRTVTFFKASERVVVDGNEQIRTRTRGGSSCP